MILRVEDLVKTDGEEASLNHLSFQVESGVHTGIKCTGREAALLFDLIEGLTLPASGSVANGFEKTVSCRADDALYEKLTVKGYLSVFSRIGGQGKMDGELGTIFSLADCWNARIAGLTASQKKRVELLRMYYSGADLLLLDDPLRDMDAAHLPAVIRCLDWLKAQGRTFLVASPSLEQLILLAERVYVKTPAGLEEEMMVREEDLAEEAAPLPAAKVFRVTCKVDDKLIFFSPDEIDYIESVNAQSLIHVAGEAYGTALTMAQLEERLVGFGFFRCHRSYLVNLQRIREMVSYSRNSYTLVLHGAAGASLPLSRGKVDELRAMLEI